MPLHIKLISDREGFHGLKEEWNSLLEGSASNSPFLRWEWLRAWWEAYGEEGRTLSILLALRGDELVGIAPFYLENTSWRKIVKLRKLMFLGTSEGAVISEYMDVIAKRGEEEETVRAFLSFIKKEDLCDRLLLQKVDSSSIALAALERAAGEMNLMALVRERSECPFIRLPGSMDEFLSGLGPSTKTKMRRDLRKLMDYPDAVFRKTVKSSEIEEDFGELVRLHGSRWGARSLAGAFAEKRFFDFHRLVMPDLLADGRLELRFLSVGGRNIAAQYNIRHNNKVYFYQAGLDISFDKRISPGALLHMRSIEEAINDSLTEYDFLLMGELDSYKKRWTADSRSVCDIDVIKPVFFKVLVSAEGRARKYFHFIKGLAG